MPKPTKLITLDEWRNRRHKPGARVRISGQYRTTSGDQVTCVEGEKMPPTPRPGMTWRLGDESRGMAE